MSPFTRLGAGALRSGVATFALVLLTSALFAACGTGSTSDFTPFAAQDAGTVSADAAPEAGPTFKLVITPSEDAETVVLGAAGKTISFQATRIDADGDASGEDVTKLVSWSISPPGLAKAKGGGAFELSGIGGTGQVYATVSGVSATATLTVKLTGSSFTGGSSSSSGGPTAFGSATPTSGTTNALTAQYPLDATIIPANLPPLDFQWSAAPPQGAVQAKYYRVSLTANGVLDVAFYTTGEDLVVEGPAWSAVVASVEDVPTTWTVEATDSSGSLLWTSPASTLTVASDTIDDSAIYAWECSTQAFHVLDMTHGTDVLLQPYTDSPWLGAGQPCSGCHRVSRDGTRFSFTYDGNLVPDGTQNGDSYYYFDALSYDPSSQTFSQIFGPTTGADGGVLTTSYRGTYAAFNPLEKTEVPAVLVTHPEQWVLQNSAGSVALELRDPDTNATVPSNLSAMLALLDPHGPGQGTLLPDWSPDGSFVVFTAYDDTAHFVRNLGDDAVLGSIVEAPVSYANGAFTFGTPKVLVAANPADDPDTGLNNFQPAVSPDGSVVAFTRAAGWWRVKTQQSPINLSGQIAMVRRSDGQVIELVNGSNGAGTTLSSTWAEWAPTLGHRYAWLAYGSERPYGHALTPGNADCGTLAYGQGSCKQLWVMAIDLQKMQSGTADPSFAPFWIPGQSIHAQYVSPQWTKAVPLQTVQ